jgi:hypothetical protein
LSILKSKSDFQKLLNGKKNYPLNNGNNLNSQNLTQFLNEQFSTVFSVISENYVKNLANILPTNIKILKMEFEFFEINEDKLSSKNEISAQLLNSYGKDFARFGCQYIDNTPGGDASPPGVLKGSDISSGKKDSKFYLKNGHLKLTLRLNNVSGEKYIEIPLPPVSNQTVELMPSKKIKKFSISESANLFPKNDLMFITEKFTLTYQLTNEVFEFVPVF